MAVRPLLPKRMSNVCTAEPRTCLPPRAAAASHGMRTIPSFHILSHERRFPLHTRRHNGKAAVTSPNGTTKKEKCLKYESTPSCARRRNEKRAGQSDDFHFYRPVDERACGDFFFQPLPAGRNQQPRQKTSSQGAATLELSSSDIFSQNISKPSRLSLLVCALSAKENVHTSKVKRRSLNFFRCQPMKERSSLSSLVIPPTRVPFFCPAFS